MSTRHLTLAAVAALSFAAAWRTWQRFHREGRATKGAPPEELQTWEGEGGGLPDGGPGPTATAQAGTAPMARQTAGEAPEAGDGSRTTPRDTSRDSAAPRNGRSTRPERS